MEAVGIIPARLHSKRLEKKLLRRLLGRSVLEWTWRASKAATKLEDLIIACDSEEIEEEAKKFGAKVVLTSMQHISGTDRICEAAVNIEAEIIVNIQADEPLMHPTVINSLVDVMQNNKDIQMATAVKEIADEEEIEDPNIVKVIGDKDDFALYFSRAKIPYLRDKDKKPTYFKHLGIYAYTKDFLYIFKNLPPSRLEQIEKLEQLRALENGFKIKTILTSFDSWGIDREEDLAKVERILVEKGYV